MPIYLTGYDTLAGRGIVVKPIIPLIQKAIVQSNFPDKNANLNGSNLGEGKNPAVALLTTITDEEMSIPPLVFPLLVEMTGASTRKSDSYLVVDVRPYLASNQLNAGYGLNIRQLDNYNFFVVNAILTASWIKPNKRNAFKFLGSAPMSVYASLISNVIDRRFALDPAEQLKISIIAAAFYSRLFDESSTIIDSEMVGVTRAISTATKAPSEMIYDVLEKITTLKNIDDMIETIKAIVDNPRLDNLNLGTLVTIINPMWYGPYGREFIVAALEHPPTWLTILYAAFTDRTMKNSGVAKISERFKGSRGGDDFIRNMKILVANAKTEV